MWKIGPLIVCFLLLCSCINIKQTEVIPGQQEWPIIEDFEMPFMYDTDLNFIDYVDLDLDFQEDNSFTNSDKIISIILTSETEVRDALFEIAELVDLEIDIDPEISAQIMIKFIDRPLKYVFEQIAKSAGLIFNVNEKGMVSFHEDRPYIKNYHLDFLNLSRSSSGSISISSSGDGGGSNSASSISSQYEGKMWEEIKTNIEYIINSERVNKKVKKGKKTKKSPSIDEFLAENEQENEPVEIDVGTEKKEKSEESKAVENNMSINYQTGLITIMVDHATHQSIEKYLQQLRKNYSLQVMIEAKIVEVNLKESYALGIDWSIYENPKWLTPQYFASNSAGGADKSGGDSTIFGEDSVNFNSAINAARKMTLADGMPIATGLKTAFNSVAAGVDTTANNLLLKIFPTFGKVKIDTAINLLNKFGSTKTISSPRVIAMNNQQAVISFVKNYIYFITKIEESDSSNKNGGKNRNTYSISSEQKTIPIGITLNILPSINPETNEIMINVRPTISKIVEYTTDPATSFLIAEKKLDIKASPIPIVELKEMDSLLKVKNGEIIVIGGMHETRSVDAKSRLPGLSKVRLIGNAFKNKSNYSEEFETVIFLKAVILPPENRKVSNHDFGRYNMNISDIKPQNWEN